MTSSTNMTMADIAKIAGVSEATVSRALKDSPLISKKTRLKIQQIARDHKYEINAAARNFRTKKTFTIAVALLVDREWRGEASDAFLMVLLNSIAEEAGRHGYDLLLSTNPDEVRDLNKYFLESKRADGLIVIGQGRNDPRLDQLVEAKAPFIVWGSPVQGHDYPTVGSDNLKGGYQAASLLIKQGCQKIAFLGDVRHPEMQQRFAGYQQKLQEANLELYPSLVVPCDLSRTDGYIQADHLIKNGAPICDGVFCVSDNIAIGAMKRFRELNISIPGNIAVVGFDDNPVAEFSAPSLTTIRQDIRKGGHSLVQNLLRIIQEQAVEHMIMPTEVVVRESCV